LLRTEDFETYPVFSSDGKTLYFCSAPKVEVPAQAEYLHYNLCSITFDKDTESFGDQVDTLINAAAVGKSVTFPRPSYDGRWILYSYADFGNFPINHKDADLWLLDLEDGSTHPLERANPSYSESFHNWSSDSHWILFASRRGDSLYSCIYVCLPILISSPADLIYLDTRRFLKSLIFSGVLLPNSININ
jgi:Tol biopolymer transport system component